jgi:hypothetical protein
MIDQLDDLPIYRELLAGNCFKLRLVRLNEVSQSISYYVAMSRQIWQQQVETLEESYSVPIELRAMTWAATAIHQNNADLNESTIPFDVSLVYENSLDLLKGGELYRTTPPENITEIRAEMTKIFAKNNFGHYNAGWKRFGHQDHVLAKEKSDESGYQFDWLYKDRSLTQDTRLARTLTTFTLIENRPHVGVDFYTIMDLPESKRIWANNSEKMEIQAAGQDMSLERVNPQRPFVYTIIPYPRAERTTYTKDQLTRITEYRYIDTRFLVDMFSNADHQSDYWKQHLYNKNNNIIFKKSLTKQSSLHHTIFCARPPGDLFSFSLFLKLVEKEPLKADYLYLWSNKLEPGKSFEVDGHTIYEPQLRYHMFNHIDEDLVIIGIKDHLSVNVKIDWSNRKPEVAEYLENLFDFYPDKKFILFTSMENLEAYITNKNVSIIPWGGDITNHELEYKEIAPVLDKNMDSVNTFVSLNRGKRQHRSILIQLLYGLGIQSNGLISCMFEIDDPVASQWEFTSGQQHIKDLLHAGHEKFDRYSLTITDSSDIYKLTPNNNPENFKNKLADYYKETFVEIITETSYSEKAFLLTEKTLNSIYGCNFPILLSSQGAVEFLRSMGMDMFDDVVNHRYDKIENPVDRLYTAINDNLELLTDNVRTKQLWTENKHRFENNVAFAKNKLHRFYARRATAEFKKIKRALKKGTT